MRHKWLLFLVGLCIAPVLAWSSQARLTVTVNEATSKVLFTETDNRVLLALENSLGRPVDVRVSLEIIDTGGSIEAKTSSDAQLKPGANAISAPFKWRDTLSESDTRDLVWYRLRYQVTPREAGQFDPSAGLISLSEITPDLFTLQVIAPQKVQSNSAYRLRARTVHPRTSAAIAGVIVDATLKFDGYDRDDIELKKTVRTGENGLATFDFQIPAGIESDDGELELKARRGGLLQTAESEIDVDKNGTILVSTDKSLYQPGQTIHTRILAFDSLRRAAKGSAATVKISDPESTVVFRTEVTTSRFGVASADWNVPENTRLGDYIVEVEMADNEEARGGATIKISRYDLPNFTVNVTPDRAYYLPGQDADVRVSGDYLFGQPLRRGHVRVVRESERHWNYREQKYETEEGDKYEGEVGADGDFVAHIKLEDDHQELKDDDYLRFRDLSYAAYVTDPTTNRTERRRFDLRLTRDAIHVYILGQGYQNSKNAPFDFYISTSYADGSPALCDVTVSHVWEVDEAQRERELQTFRTNRYGIAKVSTLSVPKDGNDRDSVSLMFRARDTRGAGGQHAETIYLVDRPSIRVNTDKPLYRDGEPVRVEVTTTDTIQTVLLDVLNEKQVLQSKTIRLENGRANFAIPFRPEFSGTLTVAAYTPASPDDDSVIVATRTVLYPHDRDLKLKMALDQETYRPGEYANARFLTRSASGRSATSVLGVVIFDKAVEERARTDSESGRPFGFYSAYCQLNDCDAEVAGVTRRDLDKLDLSRPLPEGMDLVAEVLLKNYSYEPRLFQSETYEKWAGTEFSSFVSAQMDPIKSVLASDYQANGTYPTTEAGVRQAALRSGINLNETNDPWGTPYEIRFMPDRAQDTLQIISAGPDKKFESADDFTALGMEWPYFRFTGEAINRAVVNFHARTGGYIRDLPTLAGELGRQGIDAAALRDPWGQPYQFEFGIAQTEFRIFVDSSGPDRRFTLKDSDDVRVWTSSIDYARELQANLEASLSANFKSTAQFPRNLQEFRAVLSASGIKLDELRDPWSRDYYVTFRQNSIYGDRAKIFSNAAYGEKLKDKIELTPVTQQFNYIDLRSDGEDGSEGTADDFTVATFSRIVSEQAATDEKPQPVKTGVIFTGATGAIRGTVTDPNGAVVPGTKVVATNSNTSNEYAANSSDDGIYLLKNLPPGLYTVTFDAMGFKRASITDVLVRSSSVTQLDVQIQAGMVSETVTVTGAEASMVNSTSNSMVSRSGAGKTGRQTAGTINMPLSTPRLREYFPETLLWQPSLETDRQGRAQLKFKLADNITTWKMSVIGSTEDGQIGTVEKEIKAFQPFFVEHDPPRILTEGDEISLPVVVRNYLERPQPINLEIKPENWFALLGPVTKRSTVAAGDASRETFDFRATSSVKDGKQRITATGVDANDAIEKPVSVHPDGEERSSNASDIVSDHGIINLDIPSDAIANSVHAELKIYPNLLAHVSESVEGIMSRPYGCGEQTISSSYPSLLLLKHQQKTGQDSPMRAKAQRYLRAGYERLLNYRDRSGGFTYWGHGEPDLALTAYALRFLTDARTLIEVDQKVIDEAASWLVKQQRADGSWSTHDYGSKIEDKTRVASLTAYVARVLAMSAAAEKTRSDNANGPKLTVASLKRALSYLSGPVERIDEPYLIASYALAAIEAHEDAQATRAIARLRALVHEESGANYWSLETNTPFYGWGLTGRIETTALALQAITRGERGSQNDRLVRGGILFLLKQKDRYGVWYSTQATINVLDALLALLAGDVATRPGSASSAEIMINGTSLPAVPLPPQNQLNGPITVDLSRFVQAGRNKLELRHGRESSPASVQAVATYYVPWQDAAQSGMTTPGSSSLRLVTRFDKTEAKVSDEITCHVEAERIGFHGYGMMLAEIGLPPGAEVDRGSLDKAMVESGWSISQYDILPDRVVVYLWPRAGGSSFDIKFKPRFGLKAKSAASIVYDYYNPEARATVAPTRFLVK